eukprot:1159060-Pelagomonas_calceolata.AAC.5
MQRGSSGRSRAFSRVLAGPSVPPLGTVDDKFEPENVELHCYDCLDAPDLTLIPPYEAEDDSAASSLCLPSLDTTSSPAPATNAISSSYGNLGRQMRVPLSSLTLADMRLFQEHNALGNVLYSGTCCTAGSLPVQQQSKQAAHPTDSKLQQVEGGGMGSAEAMEWAAPESSCNDEQLLQRVLRQQDVRQLGLYASGNVNLDSMSGARASQSVASGSSHTFQCVQKKAKVRYEQANAQIVTKRIKT